MPKLYAMYTQLPKALRASMWFFICSFIQKSVSVITTPIFTRLLTPYEYGRFGVFISWQSIFSVVITLNLFSGVYMQGLIKFDKCHQQYSSAMQGLLLVLIIVWSVVYFIFHDFLNNLFSMTTIQIAAMIVIIWTSAIFDFWAAEQRVDYKYWKLFAITLFSTIATPSLGIVFIYYFNDKVLARILGLAIVNFILYIGLFIAQMQHGKLFFSWKIWKYALLFNLPLVPHYLSSVILNAADRIMIEKMVGAREAGIYMVAYSISLIMTLFNTSILQTMEPWLYKKIKSHDIDDVKKVVHPAFAIIASVNVALIACAPEIVAIFAPKSYHNAIWIIPPVAMSSYFTFAYMFFCIFELYYEKTSLISIATILGAVLKLVLNYFLIYKFGYYAAAYATLICFVVYAIAHYCFMKKICLDYMHNVELYSTKILLLITSFFITLSFVMLCTYKTLFLRYLIIAVLIIFVLIRRMYIASYLQKLINIK